MHAIAREALFPSITLTFPLSLSFFPLHRNLPLTHTRQINDASIRSTSDANEKTKQTKIKCARAHYHFEQYAREIMNNNKKCCEK